MKKTIPLEVKNSTELCTEKQKPVNIHTQIHPTLKTIVTEKCDNMDSTCPKNCKYNNEEEL